MVQKKFPTMLVGSYAQPRWLIDVDKLGAITPPRTRAKELWRVDEQWLAEAQDDATIVAIREQEEAGLDIVTDGEIRRESYFNQFATALDGLDLDNPGTTISRSGREVQVPRVVGPISRREPVELANLAFLKRHATRPVKMTLPGPFTMSSLAKDDHYGDPADLAMAYAEAVREEIADLFAAGADVVQIDEPYMQARPEAAADYALPALNRALEDAAGTTVVHLCFGYAQMVKDKPSGYSFLGELANCRCDQISIEAAQPHLDCTILEALPDKTIVLGVIDLSSHEVETPEIVAERVRRALPHVDADRLVLAPDCGMKYLPREVAFKKMQAMAAGAAIMRREVAQ
ncbi:MAG: uroporphyrinogen decarboxylase family protein [Alphaproteobacteria bacterium]